NLFAPVEVETPDVDVDTLPSGPGEFRSTVGRTVGHILAGLPTVVNVELAEVVTAVRMPLMATLVGRSLNVEYVRRTRLVGLHVRVDPGLEVVLRVAKRVVSCPFGNVALNLLLFEPHRVAVIRRVVPGVAVRLLGVRYRRILADECLCRRIIPPGPQIL